MSSIVIYIEQAGGVARRASLEALGAAKSSGRETIAVVAGEAAAACAAQLAAHKAVVLTGGGAHSADALAKDLAAIVKETGSSAFLAAATATGKDIAPRVAAHLDCTLLSDITALCADGAQLVCTRPWMAGKAIATLTSSAPVFVATTRVNAFAPAEGSGAAVSTRAASTDGKVKVVAIEAKASAKLDVKEAPVVISGGRGLKGPEHWGLIEDLAGAFGAAATGATRAVVDAGWRPHGEQVGQTGKTVAPQLYIAVGISGAIQHLAGMRTSKVIVAINKDAEAPIFKVADYGIVGDAFEVVPALTKAIAAAKQS
jgi:electron transfer flavoprotein alpha subunit